MRVLNPWDGSLVGTVETTDAAGLHAALATLDQGAETFRTLTPPDRACILRRLAVLLEEHQESLACTITREMGKVVTESRGEIARGMQTVRCSADEALRIEGELLDTGSYGAPGRWGLVHKRPRGIVLAITPFNFPINLALHKIGPAFAAGCPVLFKPGPANALSGLRLVELCHEAGFPASTLQWVLPEVEDLREVVRSERVAVISFTGGVETARAIARDAGPKKLLLELGGNDPLIVFPDGDVEKAAHTAVLQRFGTAGQRCTAAKRIFLHTDVYERFRSAVLTRTSALQVGDPMAQDSFIGPVVSETAAAEILKRVQSAVEAGATVLCGGTREGAVVQPTVIEGVPDSHVLVADETFGPVMPLFRFEEEEELVRRVNQTPFGLQAGVFTNDQARIRRLFEALDVGALAVNDGPGFRSEHLPFGGVKQSGLGREGIRYAIDEMMYRKTLVW